MGFFNRLFDKDKKILKMTAADASKVESLSEKYAAMSDDELKGNTAIFKERLANGETLDDIKIEAFATVREAARRMLNEYPYPCQVQGGFVLHNGDVAEMATGSGKTLTATMPVYLNALEGKGVHVITVNEYLAARDSEWMGQIYRFLGLTVGLNKQGLSNQQKREAYLCDITYTTDSELGFDYLRDNMVVRKEDRVLRGLHFALIDEVDSILIDDSRTPLIISGSARRSADLYNQANDFARRLKNEEDYEIDLKSKSIVLTREGIEKAEKRFKVDNLYSPENTDLVHYIAQALKANFIFHKDVDYLVEQGTIYIIDPNTGRKMIGREWSDGLHQAIQAKEHVPIKQETVTVATITYQNFFRLYDKLAGMTGTAKTEEEEFLEIYNMRVIVVPLNWETIREDKKDLVFGTKKAKFKALIDDIEELHKKGQPVLVGTIAVETSESISKMLKNRRIRHEVLNAKNHAREAEIIAKAGQRGAVTIATNMAGRGTDIKLGEGVRELGGLAVLCSERHESRRIDNQLRGRSGRQGDPGFSRFYVSLEDDLMLRFGNDSVRAMFASLGDMPIESKAVSKAISSAQSRVEGLNFDIRKSILDYDMVMSEQRDNVYSQRNFILDNDDVRSITSSKFKKAIDDIVDSVARENKGNPDADEVLKRVNELFSKIDEKNKIVGNADALKEGYFDLVYGNYVKKMEPVKEQALDMERTVILRIIDRAWMDQIDNMSKLRDGIGLRSYGQTNPIQAYTEEGYFMFQEMLSSVAREVVSFLNRFEVVIKE